MGDKRKTNPYKIEEHTQEEDDATETNNFIETKELQGIVTCPDCGIQGPGIVTNEVPLFIFVGVVVLLFVIGKWAFVVAPFLFLLIHSQIRTCTNCGHIIEQKLQMSIKAVNESVYTMKFSGDLVVVVSKRYAMIGFSLILLLAFSVFTYEEFFVVSNDGRQVNSLGVKKDYPTWVEYLEDCGSLRLKANEYRVDNVFNGKYKGAKVDWTGIYLQKTTLDSNKFTMSGQQIEGYKIKMDPKDSDDYDVFVILPSKLKNIPLSDLEEGDVIGFKGELISIGNEETAHFVVAEEVSKPSKRLKPEEVSSIKFYEFQKKARMFGK